MRSANYAAGPKLTEGFMCSFEVGVERGDSSCADGKLYDGLRLQLCFCHIKEARGWEPEICRKVAV